MIVLGAMVPMTMTMPVFVNMCHTCLEVGVVMLMCLAMMVMMTMSMTMLHMTINRTPRDSRCCHHQSYNW